jgi:SAM-dependent methyltransferase
VSARDPTTDLDVLRRLVRPEGKDVVDIGCGDGALVRELARLGARVYGIEISESRLAAAVANDGGTGARYLVGRAQELPLPDASVDAAIFMCTLHHVPPADLIRSLREAARVLRPGGLVYVAEPLPEGDYFELTKLIEDELEVRRAAQRAIGQARVAGLTRVSTLGYDVRFRVAGLAALRATTVSVDPGRAGVFDAHRRELEETLLRLGEPCGPDGARCFVLPMRADLLVADGDRDAAGAADG